MLGGAVGGFGAVFGLGGLVFALIGIGGAIALVRRWVRASRALESGLFAEGQVLDTYVTRSEERSTRHVIIGFRAQDGREYRIDDTSGPLRVVGDHVPVRYLPNSPQHGVVGDRGRGTVGVLVGVVVLSVFACMGVFFAAMGFGIGALGVSISQP